MSTPSGTRPVSCYPGDNTIFLMKIQVAVKSIRVHRLDDSELLRKAGRVRV